MDSVCANHPESLALAACKACERSICLMCVHDEREGTFCSEACIKNFREVSDWGTGADSASASSPAPAAEAAPAAGETVWEEMPDAAPPAVQAATPPPQEAVGSEAPPEAAPEAVAEFSADPAPAAVPSTRSIGNPCWQHPDIRAKAFCTSCRKPICGLCIVENAAGMFCSETCARGVRRRAGMSAGAKFAVFLALLVVAGGAALALKPELLDQLTGATPPTPPEPPPLVLDPNPVPPPIPPVKVDPPPPVPKQTPPPPPPPPPPIAPMPAIKPIPIVPLAPIGKKPVPKPPEKAEAPKATRMINPWLSNPPGTWFRLETAEGGLRRLSDIGLKTLDAASYTLLVQKSAGEVQETRTEVQPVAILGEETLDIEDRKWICEIRGEKQPDGSYRRSWTLVQSRHAGAVLKAETPEGKQNAVRLWEHMVRVGNRTFDCLVIESENEATGRRTKTWYSPTFPLGAVRIESDRGTTALVATGDSWAARPPLR